ncbi:MAG: ATP-binding protein [Desulfotignum sp.]
MFMADNLSNDVLSSSLQQMQSVFGACPAGIGIVQNDLIVWANDTFYAMLGYTPGSLNNKHARDVFPTQKEHKRVAALLAKGMDRFGSGMAETRLSRKKGPPLDCRIRASRLNKKDPAAGTVMVVTDISDIKSLQIQLQQAQKMEAIGVLAGGISHDFNNILMGIQGHLSLMRIDLTATEKVISHIHQITKLVETASELTGRLLGFARGGKYQIKVLDVNPVVKMAMNLFKPTRKDLVFQESYAEDLDMVDADQSQLEQVCLYIIGNASQAMLDEGTLSISTKNISIPEDHGYPFVVTPGSYVKISIQDTGIGMDAETQKKIFDPFFSTRKNGNQSGRGLGLSTVYGIVKNHGGFITVQSALGEGTTVHVCLPATARAKSSSVVASDMDALPGGSETILLVDDQAEIINVGKNFLSRLGYKPITARNGLEAVEIFRMYQDEISLVILDIAMPKMGGKKTLDLIRQIRENIKVLVTMGQIADGEVEDLLSQGCHGFIQKPFSMYEFSKAIRNVLDKRAD